MGIDVHRVERIVHIVLAKPLAWAIYAGGLTVHCVVTACWRGLRAIAKGNVKDQFRTDRKERR